MPRDTLSGGSKVLNKIRNAGVIRRVLQGKSDVLGASSAVVVVGATPAAGQAAWFDASDLVLANGAAVASWPDKSGNGRTLTQGTAANQPVYAATGLGGKPAVSFDGTNDTLSAAYTSAQPLTVFVVSGSTSVGQQRHAADFSINGSGGARAVVYQQAAGPWGAFAGALANSGVNPVATVQVVSYGFDGATANPFYIDGIPRGTAASAGAGGAGGITVGSAFDTATPNNFWQGPISEVLVYSRVLTLAERQQTENYLLRKYGLNPITSGIAAWYDAGDLALANGAAVASWPDKSGNGHTLTQATASSRPAYVTAGIGGRASVDFDGVDDRLLNTTLVIPQPSTVFIVSRTDTTADSQFFIDGASGSRQTIFLDGADDLLKYFAGTVVSSGLPATLNPSIMGATFNGATSGFYRDGALIASGNPGTQGLNGNFKVGVESADASAFFNGHLSELLYYNRVLSDTERKQVEKYLSDKYTITVAT